MPIKSASLDQPPRNSRTIPTRLHGGVGLFLMAIVAFGYWYSPMVTIQPAFDDWAWLVAVREAVQDHGMMAGVETSMTTVTGLFWRPLNELPQVLSAHSTIASQALKLAAIVLLGTTFFSMGRFVGLSKPTGFILASLFLVHQTLVPVAGELDFWGDVWCAAAFAYLLYLSWAYSFGEVTKTKYVLGAVFATAIAVAGKEAGVASVAIPVISWAVWPGPLAIRPRRMHLFAALACLGVTGAYVAARHAVGAPLASSDSLYKLTFGSNVMFNAILVPLFAFSPVNTVNVYLGPWIWKFAVVLFGIAAMSIILLRLRNRLNESVFRMLLALILLTYALQGPSLLLPHVSEGNMIRSLLPALLCGGVIISPLYGNRRLRPALSIGIVLWILFSGTSVQSKANGLCRVHAAAADFRNEVHSLMPDPPDREILFVAESDGKGYAEFKKPLCQLLVGDADLGMRDLYHARSYRAKVVIVPSLEQLPDTIGQPDFLVHRDGQIERMTQD